ncbi:MAG: hypothetical protein RL328_2336 [Acidobacteriota bacterium]|jgi:hypothetical protein
MTRRGLAVLFGCLLAGAVFVYAQNPFKQYRETAEDYSNFPLPPDWQQPAEFVLARLKYPDIWRSRYGVDLYWTMDYPRGDRHLVEGLRRLTALNVRSVEQVTETDGTDDLYNWPFLYAVEVGMMDITDTDGEQLRDYLARGGFLMVDDFHGDEEWNNFEYALDKILPGHTVEDLVAGDTIFHTVSDVNELIQIPSAQFVQTGVTYEKGGIVPHFRAVRDKKGRIAVVICHNMDLGDSIENSDDPAYPERFSSLGYRVLTNYVIYALSH